MNDGVSEPLCSLRYVTVEDAIQEIGRLGRGAQLAKVDVRKAYRNVPVHPQERPLLGMVWDGMLFVDTTLPFGLRSAPKIFNALADGVEWIAQQRWVRCILHYLDDLLVMGSPDTPECQEAVLTLTGVLEELCLPIAEDKLEGPATKLTFLGFEIDSGVMELRLPQEKLSRIQTLLESWATRRSCSRKELESFVGVLGHACYVVRPGKTFMRRMFELLSSARRPHHYIHLNASFRSDLCWWLEFLAPLNSSSFRRCLLPTTSHYSFSSDVSGRVGCEAFAYPHWFMLRWVDTPARMWSTLGEDSITFIELLPIVMAVAIWGRWWYQSTVTCHCDNQGAVAAANSGYSKVPRIAHLLRCLFFIRARFEISLEVKYLPGAINHLADAISRDNLHLLFSQVPESVSAQMPIPPPLLELLLDHSQDWTSESWRSQFVSCFRPAWQSPPRSHIGLAQTGT